MSDEILIRGLTLECRIGVPDEERAERQTLRAHLTMEVEGFPATDEVERTVDYKVVADRLREVAGTGERKLLETLARELAGIVLEEFAVVQVKVELEKFILPETDWVGVSLVQHSAGRI